MTWREYLEWLGPLQAGIMGVIVLGILGLLAATLVCAYSEWRAGRNK